MKVCHGFELAKSKCIIRGSEMKKKKSLGKYRKVIAVYKAQDEREVFGGRR